MFRFAAGKMIDLLPAGDSRGDDFDVGTRGFHGGNEAAVTDLSRKIVMLFFESKGSGHAAVASA